MSNSYRFSAMSALMLLAFSQGVHADTHSDLLGRYAAEAGVQAFSAGRGEALHSQEFTGGKAATPACSSCHNKDARTPGHTLTGKRIEPMALSATPSRYKDAAKVEKWFKRNCLEVMGRECTPQEKGDWLTWMLGH